MADALSNCLPPAPPSTRPCPARAPAREASSLAGYAWAVLITLLATAVGWPLYHGFHLPSGARRPLLADTNILMLYLLGVLWVATRCPRRAAILASVLGVLAFDFCFVPPYLSLNVADEQYLITFAVMLLTALVISMLTHRVRTQSLAAQRAWERAEAEMLRNTLLLSVSHDLRTPVACITGAATSLLEAGDRLPPAARRQMLDIICTESGRMDRLINNLLDMTRLESGGLTLQRDWHPLQEITGSALRHLQTRLQSRTVQTRFPPDLPLIHVDGVALEQVLVNLLDNAIEYTPPDAPIEIDARATAAQVVLEVSDRGPGLPSQGTERVFEKFYRASSVCGEKRDGLGLGLAICRAIVEAHGGAITASNRDGGGALFRISLPRTQVPPHVDGTA